MVFYRRHPTPSTPSTSSLANPPQVTVMVAARNESQRIEKCIRSLFAQDYPKDKIQFLVTDDRSQDNTLEILNKLQKEDSRLQILSSPPIKSGESPKKNALSHMVSISSGELLLTTDADCVLPVTWVKSTLSRFTDEVHMVVGYSEFIHDPQIPHWFFKLQALEFLSHFVVSAAALGQNFAINSSGNNLAYRKSSFLALDGFKGLEHIISGDDDLLLHRFQQKWPRGIVFNPSPESFAQTEAQPSLSALWNQRKRWASKTVFYTPQVVVLLSVVFFFYFTTALALSAILWGDLDLFRWGVLAFVLKTLADFTVLNTGAHIFGRKELMSWFWPTAIFHLPLILGAVLFGLFGKFTWKGRQTGNLGQS